MTKPTYSTNEAAKLAGVHKITLIRWAESGKVRASQIIPLGTGERQLWRWTDADVEKIRKHKDKFYRKGRGPKPKEK